MALLPALTQTREIGLFVEVACCSDCYSLMDSSVEPAEILEQLPSLELFSIMIFEEGTNARKSVSGKWVYMPEWHDLEPVTWDSFPSE